MILQNNKHRINSTAIICCSVFLFTLVCAIISICLLHNFGVVNQIIQFLFFTARNPYTICNIHQIFACAVLIKAIQCFRIKQKYFIALNEKRLIYAQIEHFEQRKFCLLLLFGRPHRRCIFSFRILFIESVDKV